MPDATVGEKPRQNHLAQKCQQSIATLGHQHQPNRPTRTGIPPSVSKQFDFLEHQSCHYKLLSSFGKHAPLLSRKEEISPGLIPPSDHPQTLII